MLNSDVIDLARFTLSDPSKVGWSDVELTAYVNAGIKKLVGLKHDAYTKQGVVSLAAGVTQEIPDDGIELFDIIRCHPSGNVVSQAEELMVKTSNRAWPAGTESSEIENFAFDPRNPRRFLVTPPASAGAQVELSYGAYPPEVTELSDTIQLPELYLAPLWDFVVGSAYQKNTGRQNLPKAAQHMAAFASALGVKTQTQVVNAPRVGQ